MSWMRACTRVSCLCGFWRKVISGSGIVMEVLGPTMRLISNETVDDTSVAYGMIRY